MKIKLVEKSNFPISQTESYWDFVTIYDGLNDQSNQIEKLSGNLESFNISSTGNSLFVIFESDVDTNYAGFLATFHFGNPFKNIKHNSYKVILCVSDGSSPKKSIRGRSRDCFQVIMTL